jgi:hypothetical protein
MFKKGEMKKNRSKEENKEGRKRRREGKGVGQSRLCIVTLVLYDLCLFMHLRTQ